MLFCQIENVKLKPPFQKLPKQGIQTNSARKSTRTTHNTHKDAHTHIWHTHTHTRAHKLLN